ncbi:MULTISPECIES: replicative DNA helicase [Okeania]|uniref:Replicative DNA helicase n=3 Tax=Okeania TaxID=1458928 RepID=A0A3N6NQY4_9CYAN|nr:MULTISPECIES: replicative DNA helicase [Okeania]NET77365.1 replicative DNA helicase [Okeania sp. SIO1F9]RQH18977.1 replicative DNA helicase [Okeania hirsuta]RQH43127.1 replicative DNA helicase [Okeania hirsuta]
MSSDRLPPQNIEAEEAILGGILLDPEAINRVTELLRPEFFAIEAHQILYKAMWQLYNQGKPTDLMTVTSWLTDNNQLEKIGGQVKIVQLLERTVSAVNIDQYAVLVIDKYIRRKLIQAGNEIFDLGFQTATELKTILDQAEQKIFALTQDKPQQDLVPISETLINTFQDIEDRNEGVALPGLACGFYDLDAMTGGFQRSDLIIVAGRPSMGKCAAYDTLVLQKDGSLITLAEVYQRQETELLTLGKNWKFQITKPSAFIDDGIKPVFRVTTKSGRFVETTITHPFLTVDGWKPLAKLQVGEKIAVPRRLDVFGDETIPENQFASLIDSDNFCLSPIVFKLEKSQLALFIRYLFSLDGWVKIFETGAVCLGYSVVSEKFVRQVQHLLLRFGIIAAIEKVEECRSRKGKTNKYLWHLTITDKVSLKNLVLDIGNFPLENLDLSSSRLNLVRKENFWVEKLENTEGFWDKVLVVMKKFAPSIILSAQSKNGKEKTEQNFNNLTTTDVLFRQNFLANIGNVPSESLDLLRNENALVEKLKGREIFGNEIISVMEKFAESRFLLAQSKNRKVKTEQNFNNLTTTDTFGGKNILSDMRNFPFINLDFPSYRLNLVRQENFWVEELENTQILWNEIVDVMEKFAESRYLSAQSKNGKEKTEQNFNNLTTTETFCGKNILSDMRNFPSINLDFPSSRLNLVRDGNLLVEQLENDDIYWDEIVSIEPVGEKQVYDLTVPETHNFVANDICLHNTSFAVNIGHSIAANLKLPVAIFSLEMSKEQLVLRLLASEARIESNRLRSGRISQSEWEPLTSAIGTLAEMPIFIDDTPNITVNEIRSKVRQLQSEQGEALGLILLDYLQLMEGSNTDNRVLELARITRSLKGLAREISVPIIALSQLSRSVESRTNKRPMMSDLRESGCLTGDTLICLADGKKIPISHLVGKSNFSVLALNENTGKFESAIVSRVFSTGVKPIFSLQTSSGKLIRATANHPFFSMGGWKQLNTLNIGDSLAILNQKMLKYSILYCGQLLYQMDFRPKYGGNLGSVVKCREWEKPTQIDVKWDEIVEIRPDGEAEVFDLTVPSLHNFVANEIVVHNSIEQDADLVIMLYRDEYYSPDTPDQGIAEVIITKHRNGPTGTVKLLFDPQFTKFRNLAIRGNREQGTGNR